MKKLKVLSILTAGILLIQAQHSECQCNLSYYRSLDTVIFVANGGSNCIGSVGAGTVLRIDSWGVADPCMGGTYTVDLDLSACSTTGAHGKFDVDMSTSINAKATAAPMWLSAGTFINVENCCGCSPGGYFTLMGTLYQVSTP